MDQQLILSDSADIGILPWVGSEYEKTKPRLLLLCEAHYREGPRSPESDQDRVFSRDLMRGFLDGSKPYRFTRNLLEFARLVFFPEAQDTKAVAAKVAYYNFIQFFMQRRDEAPSEEEVAASFDSMDAVLHALHPRIVVVHGTTRTKSHVSRYLRERIHEGASLPATLDRITFVVAQHPSAPFFVPAKQAEDFRRSAGWSAIAARGV